MTNSRGSLLAKPAPWLTRKEASAPREADDPFGSSKSVPVATNRRRCATLLGDPNRPVHGQDDRWACRLPGKVTPQILRHTAARWLMQRGAPISRRRVSWECRPRSGHLWHHARPSAATALAKTAGTFRWLKRWLTRAGPTIRRKNLMISGRSGRIRTCDPCVPNAVLYRAEPHSDKKAAYSVGFDALQAANSRNLVR